MQNKQTKPEVSSEQQELKRGIKGWQVAFIGLGGVIGSCYFLGLGLCIQEMGPAVLIAFVVVGLVVYGLMIAYAELLVNLPRKGSFVAYTNEFLGETLSTGMGWSFWINWVCYVPSEAVAVATVIRSLFNMTGAVSYVAIAIGALAALTIINLCAVDIFAKIEAGLAITKVCVIILFIVLAFGIWVGLWGSDGFLGSRINFGGDADFVPQLFPKGAMVMLVSMVTVLVTFQGTEIVGLAAAESQDPETSVPRACKSVTYRLICLYILPILLIILIYPWERATDASPIFMDVLNYYGLAFFGKVMSAVVLIAAFSCANTGFYGTVRCMFGLSVEGLAPKFLGKLNHSANPKNAVLFTLLFMWVVLIVGLVSEITGTLSGLYGNLLELSGFTGTLAWVGIIGSQIMFRKRLKQNGYDPETCLKARVKKGQSWIPPVALVIQLFCLIMLSFGNLVVFGIAAAAVILPMIVRVVARKTGHVRDINSLAKDEKSFDETFPKVQ